MFYWNNLKHIKQDTVNFILKLLWAIILIEWKISKSYTTFFYIHFFHIYQWHIFMFGEENLFIFHQNGNKNQYAFPTFPTTFIAPPQMMTETYSIREIYYFFIYYLYIAFSSIAERKILNIFKPCYLFPFRLNTWIWVIDANVWIELISKKFYWFFFFIAVIYFYIFFKNI